MLLIFTALLLLIPAAFGRLDDYQYNAAFIPRQSPRTRVLTHLTGTIRWINLNGLGPGVETLKITNSAIDGVEDGAFCASPYLQELELHRNNPFPQLTRSMFRNCHNLKSLALRYNYGLSLDRDVFTGMVNLEKLEIRGQTIRKLYRGHFGTLANLRSLVIWSGGIEQIEAGAFDGLAKLEQLKLRYNHVPRIDGMLRNLYNLRIVNLGDNGLEVFPWEDLANLRYLLELNLRNNPLDNYDVAKIVRYAPQLRLLNVELHPLHCKAMGRIAGELEGRIRGLTVEYKGDRGPYDSCEDQD